MPKNGASETELLELAKDPFPPDIFSINYYITAACAYREIPFLTFSSDLVFDDNKSSPYVETDTPCPLNVYGNSKRPAERDMLAGLPNALVVRTSAFFSP
ncbi:sugar nucleotide-binding protein [Hymenobacter sp. BT188]|uniref:sugar nucleotide-binding protein n=1 Tax=Hymenobacter sp. BT188 TaxID=2763504 RepID=UPI001C9DAB77|nr:sugar nucleotide-binding protein [Hymenobacter sp. BT188]